jgi:hypothetical protein
MFAFFFLPTAREKEKPEKMERKTEQKVSDRNS